MNSQLEASDPPKESARSPRVAQFIPLVWVVMLGISVLIQVSLWAVSALSIVWVVVFLFYRQRLMALPAGVVGILIALGMLVFTVPVN